MSNQKEGGEKAAIISVHLNSIHARTKPRASFSFLFSRGEFLELPFIVALIIILKNGLLEFSISTIN